MENKITLINSLAQKLPIMQSKEKSYALFLETIVTKVFQKNSDILSKEELEEMYDEVLESIKIVNKMIRKIHDE